MRMGEASSIVPCPGCGAAARRAYAAPALHAAPSSGRRRADSGGIPKVMKREGLPGRAERHPPHRGVSRPWQAGH